jgi:seryl-tRNA synthetase
MTTDVQTAFRDQLLEAGLLISMGVEGLLGKSGEFEGIVEALDSFISRVGAADGAEVMRFPPGISRKVFEESEYLKSFPQLAGTVHSFIGTDREHAALLASLENKEDWTAGQKATEVVLTPAACYPVYPTLAKRGALAADGALVDVFSYCFRHEPSVDPARMQLFRMREYIRVGSPEQVQEFRSSWMKRGETMMSDLGLPVTVDVANDPFFGRPGRMLAANQREQALKFELLIPITSQESPTACLSFNYHKDKFALNWKLEQANRELAHTACVGFGMERMTLALLKHHGLSPKQWPASVRAKLWPDAPPAK